MLNLGSTNNQKIVVKLAILSSIFWTYYYCNSLEWWSILHNRCETPDSEMKALILLANHTHKILEKFNLTHFPMGGRYFFTSQYVKRMLDRIANTFNDTFALEVQDIFCVKSYIKGFLSLLLKFP